MADLLQFHKVLYNSHITGGSLPIPLAFTDGIHFEEDGPVTLIGPDDIEWPVTYLYGLGSPSFSAGWPAFRNGYNLLVGDQLLFTYLGQRTFEVEIFEADDLVQFHKVLYNSHITGGSLPIPLAFTDGIHFEEDGPVTLIGPDDIEWPVTYLYGHRSPSFSAGWPAFRTVYNLLVGDELLFTYLGQRTFEVDITHLA